MKEFIERVSARLGVGEETARQATGGLLGFVREQVADRDFGDLLGALPGSADLMGEMPVAPSNGGLPRRGGLWESVAGKALTAVGADGFGSGFELANRLKGLGLTGSQVGSLVSQFGQYVKEMAGNDLFKRIVNQVPEIKRLVG